jgi:hypothetical protein
MWRAILLTLLSLDPCYTDNEEPEAREERMTVVAKAIDYAASRATCSGAYAEYQECSRLYRGSRTELAAMLAGIGYEETRFSLHVHEGRCGETECDSVVTRDKRGQVVLVTHRARSPWQVHYNRFLGEVWGEMAGTSQWETANAAWAATVVLSWSKRRCRDRLGALSGYAGSRSCRWPGAPARLVFVERIEAQLSANPEPEMVATSE